MSEEIPQLILDRLQFGRSSKPAVLEIGSDNRYHYFYVTTNIVNGKLYFGVHNSKLPDDGYIGSGKYLWHAIIKHGTDKFAKKILLYFDSEKEAYDYERKFVTPQFVALTLQHGLCYNISEGGRGFTSQFISARNRERDENGLTLAGRLAANGKHSWNVRDENGLTLVKRRLKQKTHPFQRTRWDFVKQSYTTQQSWYSAGAIYDFVNGLLEYGHTPSLTEVLRSFPGTDYDVMYGEILPRIWNGWIPQEDPEWVLFRYENKDRYVDIVPQLKAEYILGPWNQYKVEHKGRICWTMAPELYGKSINVKSFLVKSVGVDCEALRRKLHKGWNPHTDLTFQLWKALFIKENPL